MEDKDKDKENDDEKDKESKIFIENMLAALASLPTPHSVGGASKWLLQIWKWLGVQHGIWWASISKELAQGTWHTAYDHHLSWHSSMKHMAGNDSGDNYVEPVPKCAQMVSLHSSITRTQVH